MSVSTCSAGGQLLHPSDVNNSTTAKGVSPDCANKKCGEREKRAAKRILKLVFMYLVNYRTCKFYFRNFSLARPSHSSAVPLSSLSFVTASNGIPSISVPGTSSPSGKG